MRLIKKILKFLDHWVPVAASAIATAIALGATIGSAINGQNGVAIVCFVLVIFFAYDGYKNIKGE